MLNEKIHEALSHQVNAELWSAYLYLSMSIDLEMKGLKGFSHWYYVQSQEEFDHANILINYLISRDSKISMDQILSVPNSWSSPIEILKESLAQEQKVSAKIQELATLASRMEDFATQNCIQWFVNEQVEEEQSLRDLINLYNMTSEFKCGLLNMDSDLAKRRYKKPSIIG